MFFSSSRPRLEMGRGLSVSLSGSLKGLGSTAVLKGADNRETEEKGSAAWGQPVSGGSYLLPGRLLWTGNQAHPEMEDG